MHRRRRSRCLPRSVRMGTHVEPLERRQLLSVSMTAEPTAGDFPAGHSTPVGFTPAEIKNAFGLDALTFGSVTADGSGQTVAIISAYDNPKLVDTGTSGFATSDLHEFDLEFGLPDPPSFLKVDETGGTSYPESLSNWANEEALDVEWVHAIAPKAKLILVECYSAQLTDLISEGVQYARTTAGVSVVSMSFAQTEQFGEDSYDSTFTTPSNHNGVTFVAATGDAGVPAGYPAMSPNVVAVGGTVLTLNNGSYGSETAWSSSGGGISSYESKPAYQSQLTQISSGRMTPDVAFDAEPNTGVAVYDSFNGGADPWYEVGGTSLGAPVWSGIIAITDQGRALHGMSSLDGATQTLPRLYKLPAADFHDITSGNNGFPAGAGYDLATGLGTPRINLLVPDLGGLASMSGTVSNGSSGISAVTVYIDLTNSGVLKSGDPQTKTNTSGHYTLSGLMSGSYTIRQIVPANYHQTSPTSGSGLKETLTPGQIAANLNFTDATNSVLAGSISGSLFNDVNANGVRDTGDAALVGRVFYLDLNDDHHLDSGDPTATTDANGNFKFSNLPGDKTYRIRENRPAGWRASYPSSWYYDVTLGSGTNATGKTFADTQKVYITGNVFNDINNNGKQDSGEGLLANWQIVVDALVSGVWKTAVATTQTRSDGGYTINSLAAGEYRIRVVTKSGYKETSPTADDYIVKLSAGGLALADTFGEHKV
jgi:SdrD B-like domain